MSIVNARSTRDELVIEVDSLGGIAPGLVAPDSQSAGGLVKTPKVAVIPHQQLIAAVRGTLLFYSMFTGPLGVSPVNSADELLDRVPEYLAEAHRQFKVLAARTPSLLSWDHDGVVGIYSSRQNRVRAVTFQVTALGEVRVDEMSKDGKPDVSINPWFDELERMESSALYGRGSIADIPAAQLRLIQAHRPDLMTGGEMVSVRLNRDGITTSLRPEPQWRQ